MRQLFALWNREIKGIKLKGVKQAGIIVREDAIRMGIISEGMWRELSEEAITGMKEWRIEHPRATLTEIEEALDERLGKMRARMVQDTALASEAAKIEGGQAKCEECGTVLQSRGKRKRRLKTEHNREISLERDYGECPKCKAGFFPPR